MPYIPTCVALSPLSEKLLASGLNCVSRGKVREIYALPDFPDLLLVAATDRVSIFDFVLGACIPEKGKILTALTVFWLTRIFKDISHHLVAHGSEIDSYLPPPLRADPELQSRALVVKKLQMLPVECIARGYLTGSGWRSYQKDGTICGEKLPEGLFDGAKIPDELFPIFTPTTKEHSGHDLPIDLAAFAERFGMQSLRLTEKIYRAAAEYAETRGVILADTKLEFGVVLQGDPCALILADEALTPDSSRYWDLREWESCQSERKSLSSYDKEIVRKWGSSLFVPFTERLNGPLIWGIQNLNPQNESHLKYVGGVPVPDEVIQNTRRKYHEIFERLTGMTLDEFLKH